MVIQPHLRVPFSAAHHVDEFTDVAGSALSQTSRPGSAKEEGGGGGGGERKVTLFYLFRPSLGLVM